jgi:hypothetical protein
MITASIAATAVALTAYGIDTETAEFVASARCSLRASHRVRPLQASTGRHQRHPCKDLLAGVYASSKNAIAASNDSYLMSSLSEIGRRGLLPRRVASSIILIDDSTRYLLLSYSEVRYSGVSYLDGYPATGRFRNKERSLGRTTRDWRIRTIWVFTVYLSAL